MLPSHQSDRLDPARVQFLRRLVAELTRSADDLQAHGHVLRAFRCRVRAREVEASIPAAILVGVVLTLGDDSRYAAPVR